MLVCVHFASVVLVVVAFMCSLPCALREDVDRVSDEREYEAEIFAEVVELEAESEEDYQRKLTQYKKQLEEWKLWRRKQVPV